MAATKGNRISLSAAIASTSTARAASQNASCLSTRIGLNSRFGRPRSAAGGSSPLGNGQGPGAAGRARLGAVVDAPRPATPPGAPATATPLLANPYSRRAPAAREEERAPAGRPHRARGRQLWPRARRLQTRRRGGSGNAGGGGAVPAPAKGGAGTRRPGPLAACRLQLAGVAVALGDVLVAVDLVVRQIALVAIEVAARGVDVLLLLAPAPVKLLCRLEISVLDGAFLFSQIGIAF